MAGIMVTLYRTDPRARAAGARKLDPSDLTDLSDRTDPSDLTDRTDLSDLLYRW